MTSQQNPKPDSSEEESQLDEPSSPQSSKLWLRSLLILILLGVGGGAAAAWYFIYYRLSPTVEKSITPMISRPLKMGKLEAFSFTSLKFGKTVLPPSENYSESVIIPAIEVDFTPLKLITQQTLDLDVTLIEPEVKVEQTENGQWLTTEFTPQPPGIIEIKLNTLTVENSNIALSPRNEAGELQTPVNLTLPQLESQFFDNNQRIQFQLENLSVTNARGTINLEGEARLETGEVDVSVTSNNLAIGKLARLVTSPVDIKSGNIDLNTDATISLEGNLPSFEGTASLNDLNAKLDQFSTPITNTNASVRLSGQDIIVEDFNTTFGDINAVAGGTINLATGYDLTATIEPTPISELLAAVDMESLETPVSGIIEAKIAITGALDNPKINVTANSTETIKLDELEFKGFQSELSIEGTEVVVENFQATPTTGGEIIATGTIGLTPEQNIALDVELNNVSGEIIRPYQANLPSDLGILNGSGKLTGALSDWKSLKGTGEANLSIAGGSVTLPQLELAQGRLQAQIDVDNIQPQQLTDQVPEQLQNPVSGEFRLNANLADLSPEKVSVTGEGSLSVPDGEIGATSIVFNEGRLNADINFSKIPIALLAPQAPPEYSDELLSGQFQVSADVGELSPETVSLTGNGSLSLTRGEIGATEITFREGELNAKVNLRGIPIDPFLPEGSPKGNQLLSAQFQVNADVAEFDVNKIQGTGSGSVTISGNDRADITLSDLRLNQGNWQGNLNVRNFNVVPFLPELPIQLDNPLVSTELTAQGTLDNLTPTGINIQGSGEIDRIFGGKITADLIRLDEGAFQIVATPQNLELGQLSEELQGEVGGDVSVEGTLENLTPAGITAQADLNFSQGVALITNPLRTRLSWDGEQIILQEATAENFFATGSIDLNLEKEGTEIIEQFDLTVDAENLDLARLPLPKVESVGNIDIQGLANFSGNLKGNINQPQLQGEIRLQDFAVERFDFDSEMVGGIEANARQGVLLDLTGNNNNTPDRIQIGLLSPEENSILPLEPLSLLIKRNQAIIEGIRYGEEFEVSLENLPLDLLKDFAPLPEEMAQQPASGELEGELTVNLDDYSVFGELALIKPSLGRFNSDRASANFTYRNNTITIREALLQEEASTYRGNGRLTLTETTPEFEANLNIEQGRIQDILSALQLFDISDINQNFASPEYGNANDLNVSSLDIKNQPIETQLQRFSEIKALLAQLRENQDQNTTIPPLTAAQGNFTGNINLQGTSFALPDIQGEWTVDGDAWQWGPYQAEAVTSKGSLNNGVITLLPVRLASGDSFINLSGTFGGENQSAQLRVNAIPIATIQNFVELPEFIGVSGSINGSATVAGTQDNPSARGELEVKEATLNESPIDNIQGSFSYSNSQLNFFAQGLLNPDVEPVTVTGDIPYQLPFASVTPASEELSINLNLQDESFSLLDVVSNGQLSWNGGEGEINLAITGPFNLENFQLEDLTTAGVITLAGASIGTAFLPEPLTDINSRVEFNFNQLTIQEFNADFGGGEVTATGGLALFDPSVTNESLNINLETLAVDIPDLYEGDVAGNINIAQTALEPEIGGEITVSDGEVILAETETPTATEGQEEADMSNIGFNNLNIILGENLNVVRPPIMDFLADGSLVLNGNLADMRPQGTVTLQRGQVNIGPTQFRLARGYEQTATFVPSQGLDPSLNVRLATSVAETSGNFSDDSSLGENNISSGLGTLQSVRVEALVQGLASELQPGQLTANNVLTLSSDPNRSETEILALLGGGLTSGFGQGNTALGLANLAGSTFLGTFQSTIGDVLGLSEFRIFPTLIPTETEEGEESSGSTLGFGAEAGIDISNDFSFSVLTIFNAEQTFQYSVRYRLSDDILLRGSTDLSNNESLIFEYETRF